MSVTVTILRCSDGIFCFSSSNTTTDSVKLVSFFCESVFVNEIYMVNLKGGDYAKNEISETHTSYSTGGILPAGTSTLQFTIYIYNLSS